MRFRRLIEAIGRSLVRYSEVPATSVSPQNPENRRVYSQDEIVPPSAVSPAGPDFKALAREVEARMVKITPTLLGMTSDEKLAVVRAALADLGPDVKVTAGAVSIGDAEDVEAAHRPVYAPDAVDDDVIVDRPPIPFSSTQGIRRSIMGVDDPRWSFCKFATRSPRTSYAVWMTGVTCQQFGIYNKRFWCCEPVNDERVLSALIHLPSGTGMGLFLTHDAARAAAEIAMNLHDIDWLHEVDPLNPQSWQIDLLGRLSTAWSAMDIRTAPFHAQDGGDEEISVMMRLSTPSLTPQQKEKLS